MLTEKNAPKKYGRKGQSEIVSVLLIVLISAGLFAFIYSWVMPSIEKYQAEAIAKRVAAFFDQNNANSLPSKIEFIANNGGETTFTIPDVNGLWALEVYASGNALQFSFPSKMSTVASDVGWVSLTPGAACPPAVSGVGDKSSVVCVRADSVTGEKIFNIAYKIWFRELDESATKGYLIELVKLDTDLSTSTSQSLKIIYQSKELDDVISPGKTISVTKVKILLL